MNTGLFSGFANGARWTWAHFRGVLRAGTVTSNVNVQALLADGDARDIGAAVVPKGLGAFTLQVPDGKPSGGNARGANAVDLQTSRTTAAQVASGLGAFAAGVGNTASGARAAAVNGTGNSVTGNNSACIGASNATVNGNESVAMGAGSSTNGNSCLAAGDGCVADGSQSFAHGRNAAVRGIIGAEAAASGQFAANGDAQRRDFVLRRQTTDATPVVLTSDAAAPGTNNQVILPNDSSFLFKVKVVGRRTDADNESAAYTFHGAIDRQTNAASAALVGSVSAGLAVEDNAGWDVTCTADTTNGGLAVTVTGEASKTIRWVAWVETVEVVG